MSQCLGMVIPRGESRALSLQGLALQGLALQGLSHRGLSLVLLLGSSIGASACGSVNDAERLVEPGIGSPGPRPQAFLNFPPDTFFPPRADEPEVPGFPLLLSETGAFQNLSRLEPAA